MHVFDVRPEIVRAFEAEGAIAAADLPSLARACDVIIICVPTSAVVRQAVFGKGGLAEGLSPGKVVVDQTTGDPMETRSIAADLRALPDVVRVTYVSQQQAYQRAQVLFKGQPILASITPDLLPETYEVKLNDPKKFDVVSTAISGRPGVDYVEDERDKLQIGRASCRERVSSPV